MISLHSKRLIEVDLHIARNSAHAGQEKSIRHGHISTLRIRSARRTLAACRAVIFAALSPDPADPLCPQSFRDAAARDLGEVRFIDVKGRARFGVIALSENEYRTAQRLKLDYWLYAVFNCGEVPQLHAVQDPVRHGWQPVMAVEHYQIAAGTLLNARKEC